MEQQMAAKTYLRENADSCMREGKMSWSGNMNYTVLVQRATSEKSIWGYNWQQLEIRIGHGNSDES